MHRFAVGTLDVATVELLAERLVKHGRAVTVDQAGTVELTKNGHDAAGAMHVFHVVLLRRRCHLGQARHLARHAVDVGHREVHASLLRGSEKVQHGIGRSAHRDIEAIAFSKALKLAMLRGRTLASSFSYQRRHRVDSYLPCLAEQHLAVGMRRQQRAVAGQREAERLGEQFIELAVNMPEQEPQVGQAERSMAATSASEFLLSAASIIASIRSTMR